MYSAFDDIRMDVALSPNLASGRFFHNSQARPMPIDTAPRETHAGREEKPPSAQLEAALRRARVAHDHRYQAYRPELPSYAQPLPLPRPRR